MRYYLQSFYLLLVVMLALNACDNSDDEPTPDNRIKDADGNVYTTITIEDQVWLVENLRTTSYRNGDPINNHIPDDDWLNANSGAYCNYQNDDVRVHIYGRLYNYAAAKDPRGICPPGFHIPSKEEWEKLVTNLGGPMIAGGRLKELGIDHWKEPNIGGTNTSGFTALPGGARQLNLIGNDVTFRGQTQFGVWLSGTQMSAEKVFVMSLSYQSNAVQYGEDHKRSGLSIRCIKD